MPCRNGRAACGRANAPELRTFIRPSLVSVSSTRGPSFADAAGDMASRRVMRFGLHPLFARARAASRIVKSASGMVIRARIHAGYLHAKAVW